MLPIDDLRQPLLAATDADDEEPPETNSYFNRKKTYEDPLDIPNTVQQQIDALDEAISSSHSTQIHELVALSNLCEHHRLLPSSCTMPASATLVVEDKAFARGGFADVYRGSIQGHGRVAVKRIRGREEPVGGIVDSFQRNILREAVIWKHCRHKNIVPFLYAVLQPPSLSLISEWMGHGNIVSYLRDRPEADIEPLVLDIIAGCRYIHSIGIVHGDLKGANILVNEHQEACLSDFGMANVHRDSSTTTSGLEAGSARWMAPELIFSSNPRATFASDMYSFGIVLWEVLTCRIPYEHLSSDQSVLLQVSRGLQPCFRCAVDPPAQVEGFLAVMRDVLSTAPEQRPRFNDDLPHLLFQAPLSARRLPISLPDRFFLLFSPFLGLLASSFLGNTLFIVFFLTVLLRYGLLRSYTFTTHPNALRTSLGDLRVDIVTPAHVSGPLLAVVCLGVGLYLGYAKIPKSWGLKDEEEVFMRRASPVLLAVVVGLGVIASVYHSVQFVVATIRVKWFLRGEDVEERDGTRVQLHVSNAGERVKENEIRTIFEASGEIEWLNMHYPENHCIIQYRDDRDAERILASGNFLRTFSVSRRLVRRLRMEEPESALISHSYWGWLWNLHIVVIHGSR
ncbi:hypothetical protein PM082_000100 [Marasmius tenuissimus]|nr:hypothetical protein PM082_000100 [Marasmius tenuissimus]